jgi:hypothetical protein
MRSSQLRILARSYTLEERGRRMTPRHSKRKRPAGKGKAVVRQRPRAKAPTARQVRAQIKRLENWINGLEMIPATQIYRSKVILPLFSKALTVGRALCVLVDKGFPAEARDNIEPGQRNLPPGSSIPESRKVPPEPTRQV